MSEHKLDGIPFRVMCYNPETKKDEPRWLIQFLCPVCSREIRATPDDRIVIVNRGDQLNCAKSGKTEWLIDIELGGEVEVHDKNLDVFERFLK